MYGTDRLLGDLPRALLTMTLVLRAVHTVLAAALTALAALPNRPYLIGIHFWFSS